MPTIADFEELDMTGLNVDHVMPMRSILTADYGHGYKDTVRNGPLGGTRQFVLSAGVWPDDPVYAAIGSDSWMEYYTTFFDTRLDNANEPFIIDWRDRKWLVDLEGPTYGVEVHTSDLFTPDGITVNLRRVSGLFNMPDGSVFDPTLVRGVYGWYLTGEDVPGTPVWVDMVNDNDFTSFSGDVIGVPNVRNGYGVARFSSTTNDGKITSSLDATIYEAFIVMKMRESLFSNYAGILSGSAAPNNVLLVGNSGDTRFLDLSLTGYTYRKNGAEYSASNQLAPMNDFGVVHVRTTAGLAMTNMQLGSDRDFSGRFAEVDIGEIILCDDILSDFDADRLEVYLMKKWGIEADVVVLPPAPTGLTLTVLSDTSIEASWDAGPDTTAPSVPTMAAGSVLSDTEIDWSWSAATDDTAVTGYDLQIAEDAGFSVGLVTHNLGNVLAYSSTGLTGSTTYYARVRAHDAVPNNSAYSSSVNATTDATPGWTPADLPNIQHWYKASSLVLSDNDPVSTWVDDFGTKDVTSAGSARPTYKANAGDPYVEFDGTDDVLSNVSMSGGWVDLFGVFIVDVRTTGIDYERVFENGAVTVHTMASGDLTFGVLGSGPVEPMPARPTGFMAIYVERSGTTSGKIRLDGSETTGAVAANGTATDMHFGQVGGGGYNKNMRVKEIILGDAALSGPDFALLATYINGEYGLTL